jgi:hypothetical protein
MAGSEDVSQTARLSLWFHKGVAPEITPQKLCSHFPVLYENYGEPVISSTAMLARTMQRIKGHSNSTRTAVDEGRRVSWHV